MCWKQASVVSTTDRRRAGDGSANHDGTTPHGVTADRSGGDWRRRATAGTVVAILSHHALAARAEIRGNSKLDVRNVGCEGVNFWKIRLY
jgi:hypothetical protein